MKLPTFCSVVIVLLLVSLSGGMAKEHSDRVRHENVPKGVVTKGVFVDSEIFPGTTRDYAVYVPAQYSAETAANLMIFMDGMNYARENGSYKVPIVFDNLIHQNKMPVTIAVFVNPGKVLPTLPNASARSNRSFEYDSMGDRYSRFLLNEFLPVALKDLNVTTDPKRRAVCGSSSGGICAFTVAWERPDQFGKVLSHIGSYTNIRGGWAYPGLVRKSHRSPKPLKVYLQDGVDDLDNLHGNWPFGNQDLAAALQFAGYHYKLEMTEGGHSGKWAGEVFPEALTWLWDDDSKPTVLPPQGTKPKWNPHRDATEKRGVPKGELIDMPAWESDVLTNTIRDWRIYVPAQYDGKKPAALMVFQDGIRMSDRKGRWRIPNVFDNLIHKKQMPVTIGVFLNPGHDKSRKMVKNKPSNRGYEYDSLGSRYTQFLLEEILPEVEKKYNISQDPNMRAIGGSSSGAICAFNVAWERPDQFRRVYSNVGSFTHLRGGNIFPALVRKTEPKPLRVYMCDTSGDVDNAFGSWPVANLRMSAALQYMGYDHKFVWEQGYGHNSDFGSVQFPDAMRWLWRKEKHVPQYDTTDDLRGDMTLLNLLVPGKSWEVAADGLGFADALCADEQGILYFCDMKAAAVFKLDANGKKTQIAEESVSGLEFSPDGQTLYGCQGAKNRVIAIALDGSEVRTVAEGVKPNDLAVTADGMILITETGKGQVTLIDPKTGKTEAVGSGINKPNGIALSTEKGTLGVSEYGGKNVWMFRVNAGGKLDAVMPSMTLRREVDLKGEFQFNEVPPRKASAKGDGMAVDKAGRYYVTSALGVQIFDITGRPCGLLPTPDPTQPLVTCMLAGPGHSTLYVANGNTLYKRELTVE